MKFREYLQSFRSVLQKSNPKKYVIGNSSADFDSIFGCLIYAFFLSSRVGQTYLPLIDCNKTDVPLRFDVSYVMKKLNIDYHKLLYTSDINYLDKQNVFCLYDHNQRQQVTVQQIVDHHTFDKTESLSSEENRIIYPSGSALTLLYFMLHPNLLHYQQQKFQQSLKPYLSTHVQKSQASPEQQDQLIEQIIRYGVLIDCFGFDPKQSQRWTQADKFVISKIESQNKFNLNYDDLCDLKFDQELNLGLTLEEHFRRDYKSYAYKVLGKVQYAIVCLDPDLFLQSYGDKVIDKFSYAEYQVYMIMFIWVKTAKTNTKQAQFGRQVVFSISPQIQEQRRVQILEQIEKIFQNLNMTQNISFQNWNRWSDPSATISRKKVDKFFRIEPQHSKL